MGYGGDRRGCVIDMNATDENGIAWPQLYTIPGEDNLGSSETIASRINQNGDVLGRYAIDDCTWGWYLCNRGLYPDATPYALLDLNILTVTNTCLLSDILFDGNGDPVGPAIVGTDELGVFRFTPGTEMERFNWNLQYGPRDTVATSAFCGAGWFEVPVNNKKTKQVFAPYLIRPDGSLKVVAETTDQAYDINSNEDLILLNGTDPKLYHADLGLLHLNALVTGTDDDLAVWVSSNRSVWEMNDRDPVTSFGQIAGHVGLVNWGFLLTPQPSP